MKTHHSARRPAHQEDMTEDKEDKLFLIRFYKTKRWAHCREGFLKSKGGLCERCLAKGIYKAAEVVHHKIRLTPTLCADPAIALNWDNLEALCRECHEKEHDRNRRRFKVDMQTGEVTLLKD